MSPLPSTPERSLLLLSLLALPDGGGIWPTLRGESIVLDIGATIGADAKQLLDFALMGGAMARALFEIKKPTVGLVNVGGRRKALGVGEG